MTKPSPGHLEWLYAELPSLVAKGVLSEDAAQRLRAHYGEPERRSAASVAMVGISILGAAFIIGGVILLLASNWEDLSRGVRAAIAFVPLAIAQGIVLWTLLRRADSAAWREGSAIFLTGSIGASIALIGQTYHLPGSVDSFLFTWMLLAWPLLYLLRASSIALLAMAAALSWAAETSVPWKPVCAWLFLAGLLPHLYTLSRHNPRTVAFQVLSWAFVPFLIALPPAFDLLHLGELWMIIYASLFAALLLFGLSPAAGPAANPYRLVGGISIAVLSVALTFADLWSYPDWENVGRLWADDRAMVLVSIAALGTVFAAALALLARTARHLTPLAWLWAAFPLIIGCTQAVVFSGANPDLGAVVFNLYAFALAIVTLRGGIAQGGLALTNIGMGMIAALAMMRFFDLEVPFVFRGLAFILIGVAFLSANIYMARRLRRSEARS